MSIEEAISLAHMLRDFPEARGGDAPTVEEAAQIIKAALARTTCNWITGQNARDALDAALKEGA